MAHYHGHHQYRSPFGDTTYTKVFVGGLAWETPTDKMRSYFEQFGDILEAVIITDKNTGKSKGYGFVTFRDPAAAARACSDANPMIDGRRANCNIASFGRPRPSPPRGRNNQEGVGAVVGQQGSSTSYSGMPTPQQTLPTPYFYPYGYPYTAYGYQGVYNPQQVQQTQQYYAQYYGGSTSNSSLGLGAAAAAATPFYYGGYSMPSPRPGFSSSTSAHRITAPSYVYYPTPLEGAYTPYPAPPPPPTLSLPPSNRQQQQQQQQPPPQSSTEESLPQQSTSVETDNVAIHSESPST